MFFADLMGWRHQRSFDRVGPSGFEAFEDVFGEAGSACPPPGPIPSRCTSIGVPEVLDCFDFDIHSVLARHQPKIILIARCILASQSTATPITTLRIVGHSDGSGSEAHNDALGQRRADAVKSAIETTLNRMTGGRAPRLTITTTTRGERDLLPGDAALSRRVEVFPPFAFPPVTLPAVPAPVTPPVVPPVIPPVAPPSPPSPSITSPPFRPCCMLAPFSFLDASSLGLHSSNGGILYTGKAGFVDIGHVRDTSDLTAFVYQQIHGASGASGTSITTTEGTATLTRALAPAEWLEVARSIAFDDAHAHEISSYSAGRCGDIIPQPGGHNSSFSPEDLCSNFLGTLVAERALRTGGTFATEVERQIQSLLTSLDVQPLIETQRAFALINGNWVDSGLTLVNNCYLRRRNFSRTPVKAGHSSDLPTPAFVIAPFTVSTPVPYSYRNRSGFTLADFPTRIASIRADARILYGVNFAL